jgi:hypothetical protein
VLLYVLYALTVVLGVALVLWVRRSRRLGHLEAEVLLVSEQNRPSTQPARRIQVVRGMPAADSMADALAGIRLPVHWEPAPSVEVRSPLILTTSRETPGEMAKLLSDELTRLGYRVRPTGPRSANARRNMNDIAIEVVPGELDSSVSSRLMLREPFHE